METTFGHPALAPHAAAITAQLDIGGAPAPLCARLATVLQEALRDDTLAEVFSERERSFEAWRDPQRGFVLHASIHRPGHRTPAHDHAEAWAVYGMYRGQTAYRLFDRGEDRAPGIATLTLREERITEPPEIAIVLPGQVHENWNPSDAPAWNLVIRPRPLSELWRRAYQLENGAYHPMRRTA